jgi:hypothetical protein
LLRGINEKSIVLTPKKMEITIEKTVKEKHDLQLPAYFKTNCHEAKLISETEAVKVCTLQGHEEISICSTESILQYLHIWYKSNSDNFITAYKKTANHLNSKI